MKKTNRILSLLLAAVLVLSLIPAPALAVQETHDTPRVVHVNPHYADLFTEEDIIALLPTGTPGTVRPQATTYLDLESGAQALCEGMKNRQGTIEVNWYTTTKDYTAACHEILDLAMAHTGDPKGGDAIQWVYGGWGVDEMYRTSGDGVYNFTCVFRVFYYDNAEQEAELDAAVEELLAQLNLDGKTDYEKIEAVYDYICDNISYDYEHLETPDYWLMYTAYAALVNKSAVCQGYAVLFYRLMLELGIDSRVITGWGGGPHAWNIVELDELYYNVDATWGASGWGRYYFLKSFWDFLDHERDFGYDPTGTYLYKNMKYDTIAFHNEYPMAEESYYKGVEARMDPYIFAACGNEESTIIWYVNRNGTLELEGTGAGPDYPENQQAYYAYWVDELTGLWVGEGITQLGTYAFWDFFALETVQMPETLNSIGTGCFKDCTALERIYFTGNAPSIAENAFKNVTATVYYPAGNATWTNSVKKNYGGSLTWVAYNPGEEEHTHSYTADVTAPTCEEKGCTTYTCACGDSYVSDYTDALGHDWDDGVVTIEPTEETKGEKLYTCKRCAETKTEVIPELDHVHRYEAVVTAPTCEEKGCTTYTCACGDSYVSDYTDALGHDMGAWYTVKEPTCTDNGTERRTCSRCDHFEERVTDAKGHTYTAVATAPTCEEKGCTTYACACGDSYVSDYTDALGHDMGAWYTVKEPTCTDNGTERRTCSRCDHFEERVTEALGHDYADGTCTRCGGACENPFTDVPEGQWFTTPVLWAVEKGITTGTSATTFDPNGQCMRAHVVTFLWRAAGQPEPTTTENPFVDVKETDFYYKAVLWAVENGITNGLDSTHFGPFAYCNRAQVVTFLYRAMGNPEVAATDCPFTDVAAGAWYEAPILWAVENGITNGMGGNLFGVEVICNRAQVVTFLYRTYNKP